MSEEKKTKECPYCGEEILATAKKCKHCGEWLVEHEEKPLLSDEEIDQIAEDAVNEVLAEQEEEEKKENRRQILKNFKILGIFAIFLFLLILTVPSESRFLNSLNRFSENYVHVYASEVNRLCSNNGLTSLFGEREEMDMAEQVKANYANMFSYENELFFGTGKLDDQLIMVGALGFVFNLSAIVMSEDDIREEAVNDWENGLKYSAAAGSLLGGVGDFVGGLFESTQSSTSNNGMANVSSSPDSNHQITSKGIGPIYIGMSVSSLPSSIDGVYSYYQPYEQIDDDGYNFYDAYGNELFSASAYETIGAMSPSSNLYKVKIGNKWYGLGDAFPSDKLNKVQDNRYTIGNISIYLAEDEQTIDFIVVYPEDGDDDI